jgi:NADPH:quinone reductase-like Zn-dependent oxidoreductase
MAAVPTTMRALEGQKPGGSPASTLYVTGSRPTPKPGSAHAPPASLKPVLVKVEYAAINPVDNFILAGYKPAEWPHVLGNDFSGTVAEVPQRSPWSVGDRVWGYSGLGHAGGGTFAEYCGVPGDLLAKVPEGVPMERAATLGCTGVTACAGLWAHLGLSAERKDGNEGTTVLIYGASTCVGQYAVQLAKLAGARVGMIGVHCY